MATVIKRKETRKEDGDFGYTVYQYIVKGSLWRCQLTVYDYDETEDPHFFVAVMSQSYHKYATYKQCGENVYRGISLKEAWELIEGYCGENIPIPDTLKQIQPFIAQQT